MNSRPLDKLRFFSDRYDINVNFELERTPRVLVVVAVVVV